jgi:hypothetical protein
MRFSVSLRSLASICGLDYESSAGGFRLVLLNHPVLLPGKSKRSIPPSVPPGDTAAAEGGDAGEARGTPRLRTGKEVLAEGWRFFRRIRRTIRMRRLTVRFAAGNPAWTGMLAGLAGTVFAFADPGMQTEWIPDFTSSAPAGSAEIEARFTMARFLAAGLGGAVRLAVVARRNG